MADDLHVIADLLSDAFDVAQIEVSDLLKASPFVRLLKMEESSNGVVHKYVKETGAPVVGFRDVNAGRDLDSSDETGVSIDLKALDWTFQCDVLLANGYRRGKEAYLAKEGLRHIAATLLKFEKQVINGTAGVGDAAGFTGFRQATTVDALADAMVVNAGGTTAATASSVWGVRIAENGVCGVYKGPNGFEMEETVIQQRVVNPGTDNKTLPTYYTPGFAWLGVQVGSAYDIGRIANLTGDSGKGLNDALIYDLLSKYPVGNLPTHLLMSRRSLKQLRASRTATNATGAPAPIPTEVEGIPIVVTDAIADTEALLT